VCVCVCVCVCRLIEGERDKVDDNSTVCPKLCISFVASTENVGVIFVTYHVNIC
jgi:hypothetical protein